MHVGMVGELIVTRLLVLAWPHYYQTCFMDPSSHATTLCASPIFACDLQYYPNSIILQFSCCGKSSYGKWDAFAMGYFHLFITLND